MVGFPTFLDLLYSATVDARRWFDVLCQVAGLVGGDSGVLVAPQMHGEVAAVEFGAPFQVYRMHNLDSDLTGWAAERISAGDLVEPFSPAMVAWVGGDYSRVAVGRRALPMEELRDSPYWNEYCAPADITDVAGIVLDTPQDSPWPVLSLYHGRRRGIFQDEEIEHFQRLAPHLQRAARLTRRFAERAPGPTELGPFLAAARGDVLIVDAESRILASDGAVERSLSERGLAARSGRLSAQDPRMADHLKSALSAATRPGRRLGSEVRLQGPLGPVLLSIMPLAEDHPLGGGRPGRALVHLSGPRADGPAPRERMVRLFGVTSAEIQILEDLIAGATPTEIADRRHRSLQTVRTQIKRICAKTGCHGVGDLLALTERYSGAGG